ncbi:glycerophosphodiester phosphodiesterase [Acetivibrio cellulolyticus]|uniref:glycerophosphodiester phosphodiesterase n=1 Tax=Acetivibrio cellulolyticus TaxID=35830 RepID=UPI0001E2DECD|nr:glycerophosphodiester phosphodiesterase [Acetivibrio cellulolyticus]
MDQIRNDLKPMSVGDVLDYSVEAFKQNFKGLVLLSLILYIPWIVFYSLTVNIFAGDQMSGIFDMYKDMFSGTYSSDMLNKYITETSTFQNGITGVMSSLQILYSITIKLVLNAAVIKMIYNYALSGKVEVNTFSDAIKHIKGCFRYMPKMIGNALLFVIIVGAAYLVSVIAAALIIMIPIVIIVSTGIPPVIMGIIIALLVLFVLVGVVFCIGFFAIKFMFGANIIVLEEKPVFESFKRSFYLSKGRFWHIALASIFAILLYYLFNWLLVGATMLLAVVNNTLYIVVNTFSQICAALMEPFILVYITVLFVNMKVQKEGLDLEVKMRKLISDEKTRLNNVDGETADA